MGLFDKLKAAMGQAQPGTQAGQHRGALESQGHEQNRILSVGQAGTALIRSHVDTGENAAGNPVWIFDLEVTPEGGAAYAVRHREILSSMAMGSYGDGTAMACRIDPADPHKIAFGEKPFM